MSNPPGPDHDATPEGQPADDDHEPATEVLDADQPDDRVDHVGQVPDQPADAATTSQLPAPEESTPGPDNDQPEPRRYTAPGFDAGSTAVISPPPEPATEVLSVSTEPVTTSAGFDSAHRTGPTIIPPDPALRSSRHRSWRWVIAVVLVIVVLAAVTVFGTVWLTHKATPRISQQDLVRVTIQNFDVAVQKGDLARLRSITCGTLRDSYAHYDDASWSDTHARVAAAKQYPVVASIDQVVVNDEHAEANVTTFMAYAPQTRSTRSFDLQYRDGQWKICQAPDE